MEPNSFQNTGHNLLGKYSGGKVTKIELVELLSDNFFHLKSLTYP